MKENYEEQSKSMGDFLCRHKRLWRMHLQRKFSINVNVYLREHVSVCAVSLQYDTEIDKKRIKKWAAQTAQRMHRPTESSNAMHRKLHRNRKWRGKNDDATSCFASSRATNKHTDFFACPLLSLFECALRRSRIVQSIWNRREIKQTTHQMFASLTSDD